MKPVALIMAGGTGGHIFPGLAIAQALEAEGWAVHWLGGHYGLETTLVPEAGYPLHQLAVRALRGKSGLARITGPLRFLWSIVQALGVMRRLKPKVCIGFGGYPAAPGGVAAWLSRCPLVIHEQNAVAGLTNRALNRFATRTLTAFPEVLPKGICVGNPVRSAIHQVGRLRLAEPTQPDGAVRVLIVGGSQGARSLNQRMPDCLAKLNLDRALTITHQTGSASEADVRDHYEGLKLDARVVAFIERMDEAYRSADIVVCRAGALTVSELAAAAMPSVLVPFPYAVDDHQNKNAEYLEQAGAAVIVQEAHFDMILTTLSDVLRAPETLLQMARAARMAARPEAIGDTIAHVTEVARG